MLLQQFCSTSKVQLDFIWYLVSPCIVIEACHCCSALMATEDCKEFYLVVSGAPLPCTLHAVTALYSTFAVRLLLFTISFCSYLL
jgi:hypothetical protein